MYADTKLQIIKIATKYNLMSSETSMVGVDKSVIHDTSKSYTVLVPVMHDGINDIYSGSPPSSASKVPNSPGSPSYAKKSFLNPPKFLNFGYRSGVPKAVITFFFAIITILLI